ncbi:hypothetical protein Tco_0539668 [Tanacetum coccineum]
MMESICCLLDLCQSVFCCFHEEQCSTNCDHCSLSNIPSSLPMFHTQWEVCDSNTGSVVAIENTGSDVVGMENEDSDGDGTVRISQKSQNYSKNEQARTRESEEYKAEAPKPKSLANFLL